MENKIETAKEKEVNQNKGTTQNVILAQKKTPKQKFFYFDSFGELPDLIRFIGKVPFINEKSELIFGRTIVKVGNLIEVNQYGSVINTYTIDEFGKIYDAIAQRSFDNSKDKNNIIPKPKKVKK